jgi:hypothetical protein
VVTCFQDALEVADVSDRVDAAAEAVYQALIEAELTDLIDAAQHERFAVPTRERRTPATPDVPVSDRLLPPSVTS